MTIPSENPSYREKIDLIVSTISKLDDANLKGKVRRLNPIERKVLEKALEVFQKSEFENYKSLETLVKRGGDKALDQIYKVLTGQRVGKTISKIADQNLLRMVRDARTAYQDRTDPFAKFETLSPEEQLTQLHKFAAWEQTEFRLGLKSLAATEGSEAEWDTHLNTLQASLERSIDRYEMELEKEHSPEVSRLLEHQLNVQKNRLEELGHISDPEQAKELRRSISETVDYSVSMDMWKKLNDFTTAPASTRLKLLELLNSENGKKLLLKLNLAVLRGPAAVLTEKEAEIFHQLGQLKKEDTLLSLPDKIKLFFLGWLNRKEINRLQTLDNFLRGGYSDRQDPLYALSHEFGIVDRLQEELNSPFLTSLIKKAESDIGYVMMAQQARAGGYNETREKILDLGETASMVALLDQSQEVLLKTITAINKKEIAFQDGKTNILSWLNENPYRQKLLQNFIGNIESFSHVDQLKAKNIEIVGLKEDLSKILNVEKTKLYSNGEISLDGIPILDRNLFMIYFAVRNEIKDIEDAILFARQATLQLGELLELQKQNKADVSIIKKMQDGFLAHATDADIISAFNADSQKGINQLEQKINDLKLDANEKNDELNRVEEGMKAYQNPTTRLASENEMPDIDILKKILDQKIYTSQDKLDNELRRQNYAYINASGELSTRTLTPIRMDDEQTKNPREKGIAGIHYEIMRELGLDTFVGKEEMFNLLSLNGFGFLNANRAAVLTESGSPSNTKWKEGENFSPLENVLIKRDDGNYELLRFDILMMIDKRQPTHFQMFDIAVFSVLLDGKKIEKGEPLSKAVIVTKRSPPLQLKRADIAEMAGVDINPAIIQEEGEAPIGVPAKAGYLLYQALVDSISDYEFRNSARLVVNAVLGNKKI